MLQGERDLTTVFNMALSELAPLVNAQHAVFYVTDKDESSASPSTSDPARAVVTRTVRVIDDRIALALLKYCSAPSRISAAS